MKACSFLPAVTQMIYDMGLQDQLHGITFECPSEALNEKQKVVRCILEGKKMASKEIDECYSASKAKGESLYYVDQPVLESIMPDVIFTQDVCEVCQIDTECTANAVAHLDKVVDLIPISPNSLEDVFKSLHKIAVTLKAKRNAVLHEQELRQRIGRVVDVQRQHHLTPRAVSVLEWVEPIYNCGHWIPDQIALAGGIDMLSNPKGDSIATPWEKIRKYDPEVLIVAPCGYLSERTLKDMDMLLANPGWSELKAVQNDEVYIIDFDLFTQPCASTLVDGIELLAALFNSGHFEVPTRLGSRYRHFETRLLVE